MSAEMPTRSESGPAASKRQVIASLLYKSGLMKPVSRLRSLLKRDLRKPYWEGRDRQVA